MQPKLHVQLPRGVHTDFDKGCAYFEMQFSITTNPSNHHVRVRHPTIGWNDQPHPSRRTSVDGKINLLFADIHVPVNSVGLSTVVMQRGATTIAPLKLERTARAHAQKQQYTASQLHACQPSARSSILENSIDTIYENRNQNDKRSRTRKRPKVQSTERDEMRARFCS